MSLLLPALAASAQLTASARLSAALGMQRRMDAKFDEFIDTRHVGDGYGQRRRWTSVGSCPRELTSALIPFALRLVRV